jgi:FMN phosphatase YigB (HAD superfamily)
MILPDEAELKDKLILVDCDGVLLDWSTYFYHWTAEKHGVHVKNIEEYDISKSLDVLPGEGHRLVTEFNSSLHMATVGPLRDAVKYIRKLNIDHGYKFHVITSQTDDKSAREFRKYNLETLFGESVFDGITILNAGDDKSATLSQWKDTGCYWIEDKPSNADTGSKLGLSSILIAHNHNIDNRDYTIVSNWKMAYKLIVGDTK